MRVAHWRSIALGIGLVMGLAACGEAPVPTTTLAPPTNTLSGASSVATAAPTSVMSEASSVATFTPLLPLLTATAVPATPISVPATAPIVLSTTTVGPATGTAMLATTTAGLPTATPLAELRPAPSVRARATDEPEDCFQSVGGVYHWMELVDSHKPGNLKEIASGLMSACVDDRRLALWALGSVHDAAGAELLDHYLAAHPAGDWVRDEYDLVPVAQAARAYLRAPQTLIDTYAVRPISIYSAIPQYSGDGQALTGPLGHIAPGTRLTRLARVPTDRTRPDHGGDTALVFERVQSVGDSRVYFIDISQYVAADPPYFVSPRTSSPMEPTP